MRSRAVIVFLCLFVFWGMLIFRAAVLQVIPHEKLSQTFGRQYQMQIQLKARRGDILDRNGVELGSSVTTYSLFADPSLIDNEGQVALKLARKLGLSLKKTKANLRNKKRRFVWISRRLSKEIKNDIGKWGIRGLAFIKEYKRIYPNNDLLGSTLGFVGNDERGLEGIEGKFDEVLSGESKSVQVMRDAKGRPLIEENEFFLDPPTGKDVYLTIDRDLQYKLEQELVAAIRRHEARQAIGVVLDVHTSEILGIGVVPGMDPNHPNDAEKTNRKNRAVTDIFEPGSTLKTFSIATSLEEGLVRPNSRVNCEGGELKIGKHTIREADSKHVFQELTVADVLAKSSNIGTTKIAFELGNKKLYKGLKKFGFGEKTGVDFWGEASGTLSTPNWRKIHLSNISFGHGIGVTALQIANAYAAVANGGVLHRPFLVKKTVDSKTGEENTVKPFRIRRAISEETSRHLRLMLTSATGEGGTGTNARVEGYLVAGKTGTAQKYDFQNGGYKSGRYLSSFAGFVPANEPKYVIYVMVDDPQKGFYGSDVAAPVFSRIASYVLREGGVRPVVFKKKPVLLKESIATKEVKSTFAGEIKLTRVPNLVGLTLKEVLRRLQGADVDIRLKGKGRVSRIYPEVGKELGSKKQIQIYLSNEN